MAASEMRTGSTPAIRRLLVPLKSGDIPLLARGFFAVMQE